MTSSMNALCSLFSSNIDSFNEDITQDPESAIDPIKWIRQKTITQLKTDPAYDLMHQNPGYSDKNVESFIDNSSFNPPTDDNIKAPSIIAAFGTWIRDQTAQSDGKAASVLDEYLRTSITTLENEMKVGYKDTILNKSSESNSISAEKQSMSTPTTQLPPPKMLKKTQQHSDNATNAPLPIVPPIHRNESLQNGEPFIEDDTDSTISDVESSESEE